MHFFKKTFVLSICLFSIPAFCAPAATIAAPTQKKLVDKIVAVVNEDIILYSEFETTRKGMEDAIKKDGDKKGETANAQVFSQKVLQQMIEDKLIEHEVKLLGLEATDAQVENVVAEIMKNNHLQTRKELENALRGEGVSYDDFVSEYRKRIARNNFVVQNIRPKIKISDDEIETEYKKRTQNKPEQIQYQLSMIMISKSNISQKDMEKLRKSINSLADFAKVANEKTEGPGGTKGGDMGWIDPSDLQAPLNEAAVKLKKGNVSDILSTDTGYYILACIDTKTNASAEETKIKNDIQEDLMNTLITKNLNQYIIDLKQKAHIETFL